MGCKVIGILMFLVGIVICFCFKEEFNSQVFHRGDEPFCGWDYGWNIWGILFLIDISLMVGGVILFIFL